MTPRFWAALAVLGSVSLAHAAGRRSPSVSHAANPSALSLRDRVGAARLELALRGQNALERERALTRLGSLGTAHALDLLVRALDPNGSAQSARERLIAVRMLAKRVDVTPVRECLVRVMTGISTSAERAEPLQGLLRDTSALALSASGDAASLEALGKALRQPGRVAQAAAAALAAHPPSDLAALVRAHFSPTEELVRVLENLGDERAFELLRDVVRRAPPDLKASAALALTRLGNYETVELARRWSETPNAKELRVSALQIFLLSESAEAGALLAELLRDPETRAQALGLAAGTRDVRLEAALLASLPLIESADMPQLFAALAQNAGSRGLAELARQLELGHFAGPAAYALASSPNPDASAVLLSLLAKPEARRFAARALVLRRGVHGELDRPLKAALATLLASADVRDRAVGAYGTALLAPERAAELIASKDASIVQAAARAAPFVGTAAAAVRRLVGEPTPATRSALALLLIDPEARDSVPTQTLLELVADGGVASFLALFALSVRETDLERSREYFDSPDPLLRAATALGLGENATPRALGVLANAYRFEADADVRFAIVHALSRRKEPSRLRTLELAAALDPEARVREAARLGLGGARPATFAAGRGLLWAELDAGTDARVPAAVVLVPGGLGLPVLADPDGVLAVSGLPPGLLSLRLALEPRGSKAPTEIP